MKKRVLLLFFFLFVLSSCVENYFSAPQVRLANKIETETSYQVFHVEVYEEEKQITYYVMPNKLDIAEGATPEFRLAARRAANQFFFEFTWKESVNAGYEVIEIWAALPQKVLTIDGEVGVAAWLIFVVRVKKDEVISYFESEERGYFEYHVPFVRDHMVLIPDLPFRKDANHWKKSDMEKLEF